MPVAEAPTPGFRDFTAIGQSVDHPDFNTRPLSPTVLEFVCEILRHLGRTFLPIASEHSYAINTVESKDATPDKERNVMQHSHYRFEGKTLRLMRVAVDLFLAAVQPPDSLRSCMPPESVTDEFINWMMVFAPPSRDVISPMDLVRCATKRL